MTDTTGPAIDELSRPLADRLRPRTLGQEHLLADEAPIGRMVRRQHLVSAHGSCIPVGRMPPWSWSADRLCPTPCARSAPAAPAASPARSPTSGSSPTSTRSPSSPSASASPSTAAAPRTCRCDLITIGGGSAGANLAAALGLKVRDESGSRIAFQLLEVPALDLTLGQPSHQRFATGYGLTLAAAEMCVRYYLASPEEATNPYVSPLLVSGLPPAHIMSAEYDPLRDDGERYAERLTEAGVPATFSLHHGHIHLSPGFTKVMTAARSWREEAVAVLRRANLTGQSPQEATDESSEFAALGRAGDGRVGRDAHRTHLSGRPSVGRRHSRRLRQRIVDRRNDEPLQERPRLPRLRVRRLRR
ncbi:alpha/beta hydrolase fold domain-containing protein [Amycolatopsis sp. NPDC051045]|uniref:alpha/beta hydrolase fold domain-containing protein n=1 Tax=Amycolatopsis sp. NPDC051045 TaxID=3156922 RepID=UPI003414DD8D